MEDAMSDDVRSPMTAPRAGGQVGGGASRGGGQARPADRDDDDDFGGTDVTSLLG